VFDGHKNAVLDLHWSADGERIFSASADKTVLVWDTVVGTRIKRLGEHKSFVNSCCPSRKSELIVTVSDDKTAKLWDLRKKGSLHTYEHKFQLTTVALSQNDDQIFAGGIDGSIKVWDLRKGTEVYTLSTQKDIITGLRLSPDGSYLLSNSMDNSLHMYDVRPYVPGDNRLVKVFNGAVHGFDQNLLKVNWSPDGNLISAGSADRFVYLWDTASRKFVYKLPGHTGTVNEVAFHPSEPIIASCSADKKIYLGEIEAS